jgi:hypothetical protein
MTTDSRTKSDLRSVAESKNVPKAVADGVAGRLLRRTISLVPQPRVLIPSVQAKGAKSLQIVR